MRRARRRRPSPKTPAALHKAARKKPLVLSAVSGLGMKAALYALAREVGRAGSEDEPDHEVADATWAPKVGP